MQNNIENNISITNENNSNEKTGFVEKLIKEIMQKLEQEKILVIDRFEGNFAVCEDRKTKKMLNIERTKLPNNVQEGDVLKSKNNKYEIDVEERKRIEERINEKINNLFDD